MRRVIVADSVSVGIRYMEGGKEVGHLHYNLVEGQFTIVVWPESFTAFRKIGEYFRILRFASSIVKAEMVDASDNENV